MAQRRGRTTSACPCGLGPDYAACCGRLHRGGLRAETPELLMRSRYSAYAVGDASYLLSTWHPSVRPARLVLDQELRWTGLEVLGVSGGTVLDRRGTVRFRARALRGGRRELLEEDSLFVRDDGRWSYAGPVSPPDGAATAAP